MDTVDHSQMRLGKHAPKQVKTLKMRDYITQPLPVPNIYGLSYKVKNLGMMLNDTLGDCTCAAVGHIIQSWTAEAGKEVILSDAEVEKLYENSCGYNPADPSTDQGGIEIDVLNYWKANTVFGHALSAYVTINYADPQEVKEAVYYFGGSYIGLQLPLAYQTASVWNVQHGANGAPGSWGGHAVPIVDYNPGGPIVISWGKKIQMTWGAMNKYADEAYALLSPDIFMGIKSITGFKLVQLRKDLMQIASG